jgi:uncharacterized protein DUF3303
MARIRIPVESGNKAITDGSLPSVMRETTERWHPEATYYTTFDGQRTAFMVFEMSDTADIPPFAEPLFSQLNAEVEVVPVMDGTDLAKGLSQLN